MGRLCSTLVILLLFSMLSFAAHAGTSEGQQPLVMAVNTSSNVIDVDLFDAVLMTLSDNGVVEIYNITSAGLIMVAETNLSAIHPRAVAIAGWGLLLVCSENGSIYLVNPDGGRVVDVYRGPAFGPLRDCGRECIHLGGGVVVFNDSVVVLDVASNGLEETAVASNYGVLGSWDASLIAAEPYVGLSLLYGQQPLKGPVVAYLGTRAGGLVAGAYGALTFSHESIQVNSSLIGDGVVCGLSVASGAYWTPEYMAISISREGEGLVLLYELPEVVGAGGGINPVGAVAIDDGVASAAWVGRHSLAVVSPQGALYIVQVPGSTVVEKHQLGIPLKACTAAAVDEKYGLLALVGRDNRVYIVRLGDKELPQPPSHSGEEATSQAPAALDGAGEAAGDTATPSETPAAETTQTTTHATGPTTGAPTPRNSQAAQTTTTKTHAATVTARTVAKTSQASKARETSPEAESITATATEAQMATATQTQHGQGAITTTQQSSSGIVTSSSREATSAAKTEPIGPNGAETAGPGQQSLPLSAALAVAVVALILMAGRRVR
ncbi:hypothetical protein [Pyrodictium abyssi]|uniref:Uncharacterized protein n=1 Tax=Pyrodictium abyssi TaxID=54256 RepID=A0ABM8J0X8_9CREN|nr:hypothetical protein PABY_22480 [Pyrodictium abyssi]